MTQQEIYAAFDAILTLEASGDYVKAGELLACINKHEKNNITMTKAKFNTTEILKQFRRTYGYVEIDESIVARFVRKFKTDNIHLLYDWCISQSIHYGVQE